MVASTVFIWRSEYNVGLGEAAKLPAATVSIGENGWISLPTGNGVKLIIQWGYASCAGAGADKGVVNNFTVPFPNAALRMVISHSGYSPAVAGILSFLIISKSQFRAFSSGNTEGVTGFYIAIGY